VIEVSFESDGLMRALEELPGRIQARAREGIDATCEAIAARARETTKYKDQSGLLRSSTQNAGVSGDSTELVGVVSFAARSPRGYLYGLAQEYGTRTGVTEKRFIRDAIDAQTSDLFESAIARAFKDAGFGVRVA
jgi:hypothetical protein